MQNLSKNEVTFYFFYKASAVRNVDMIYSIHSCVARNETQM